MAGLKAPQPPDAAGLQSKIVREVSRAPGREVRLPLSGKGSLRAEETHSAEWKWKSQGIGGVGELSGSESLWAEEARARRAFARRRSPDRLLVAGVEKDALCRWESLGGSFLNARGQMASVDLSFLSQDRRCANWDCASKCKLDWRDTKPGGPSLTTGAVPIIA
eukprot:1157564-Pelagomonas_calceolata.AAC.6